MLKFLAALCVAGTIGTCDTFPKEKVIRADYGGSVLAYQSEILKFIANGGRAVRIDGVCASACLYWIHSNYKLDVCATPRAQLGFHMPYTVSKATGELMMDSKYIIRNFESGIRMMSGMPVNLQVIWGNMYIPNVYNGDAPAAAAWIRGMDVVNAIGACK